MFVGAADSSEIVELKISHVPRLLDAGKDVELDEDSERLLSSLADV
jgi:hypothetical protein